MPDPKELSHTELLCSRLRSTGRWKAVQCPQEITLRAQKPSFVLGCTSTTEMPSALADTANATLKSFLGYFNFTKPCARAPPPEKILFILRSALSKLLVLKGSAMWVGVAAGHNPLGEIQSLSLLRSTDTFWLWACFWLPPGCTAKVVYFGRTPTFY